ncbi:histidine kinase [Novosphingobium sp. 1949]|uniref:Histidine kinase n=1 Tax=Novosphingobium organovorum TaxID=2930092 RepID=A0ABT0BFP3_9SPHN|nr:histidine kinase [Novosphingobium organovorum]MCJ2183872.1 histidine kinase [Novosphingobium organovorum]
MGHKRFKPTPIPRERRQRQCARFALTDADGAPIHVMVRDISTRGLSAAALGAPPDPETVVRARLADGQEIWGLVRWTQGNLFGVEFDTRQGAFTPPS